MCNCGKKREDNVLGQSLRLNSYRNIESARNTMWDDVYFEYTGLSALSVTGNVSGKHYRFSQPGNIQLVDHRDAPGMVEVPVLRKVDK